jgi:hypothetical protein
VWTADWRRQLKINSVYLCSLQTEFSFSVLQNHTRMEIYFASLHLANVQIRYRRRVKWRQQQNIYRNS